MPNNGSSVIRGVFSFGTEDDTSGSAVVYVETAHPGMTISYTPPQVRPCQGSQPLSCTLTDHNL